MFRVVKTFKVYSTHNGGRRVSFYNEGETVPESIAELYPANVEEIKEEQPEPEEEKPKMRRKKTK